MDTPPPLPLTKENGREGKRFHGYLLPQKGAFQSYPLP